MGKSQLSLDEKDNGLNKIQEELLFTVKAFINDIFNYEKIDIAVTESTVAGFGRTSSIANELVAQDGHVVFHFSYRHIGRGVHNFQITNIPAVQASSHIAIFFKVIVDYIHNFYENLLNGYSTSSNMTEFSPHIDRAKTWLQNIERIVIIQYLFRVFNSAGGGAEGYSNQISHIRYDLDHISKILNFGIELNTRKLENEEIYCGFVFHNEMSHIRNNSVRSIRFKKVLDFGDFSGLKNYLTTSNGQDIFFNVTNRKITHLFVTKEKVNEIYMNPAASGKTFETRPLILSVQGNGRILFIEGRRRRNQSILEINNSRPLIRDSIFVQNIIERNLRALANGNHANIQFLSRWIMSLSQKKHGTSIIFLEVTPEIEKGLVKSQPIAEERGEFLQRENSRHDLFLLDSLTKPDGAIIFNFQLIPTHISTILPINPKIRMVQKGGGARHNSISNFTGVFKCTGIVISEDGPISIFNNGLQVIKF
jgi:hypothetical protein